MVLKRSKLGIFPTSKSDWSIRLPLLHLPGVPRPSTSHGHHTTWPPKGENSMFFQTRNLIGRYGCLCDTFQLCPDHRAHMTIVKHAHEKVKISCVPNLEI